MLAAKEAIMKKNTLTKVDRLPTDWTVAHHDAISIGTVRPARDGEKLRAAAAALYVGISVRLRAEN